MNKEIKFMLIEKIVEMDEYKSAVLYEILINEDYDYIQNLMTKEEFEDFIEKWTPNKCSEGEN